MPQPAAAAPPALPQAPPAADPQNVPWRALLLVLPLLVLLGFGLRHHFYLWYSQRVGDDWGSVSEGFAILVAVVGLLLQVVGKEETQTAWRTLLKRLERWRYGYMCLIGANVVALLFIGMSTSVYVTLKQGEKSSKESGQDLEKFTVEVREGGRSRWPPAELSQVHPQFFRFYLKFRTRRLGLHVIHPDLYKTEDKVQGFGSSLRFQVPPTSGFKEYYAVRIVPGEGLFQDLPPPKQQFPGRSLYDLTIKIRGRVYDVPDLRREMIYLGLQEDELRILVQQLREEEWEPTLCGYVETNLPGTGDCRVHPLRRNPPRYESLVLSRGDVLTFDLTYTSKDGVRRRRKTVEQRMVANPRVIETVFLSNLSESTP